MTVATEVENNTTVVGEKENKEVKDMKTALNEEMPADNKQQGDDTKETTEKIENEKKDDNTTTGGADESSNKSATVHKTNYEKDVVYLYQYSRTPVIPSISASCLKVETWLRLNEIKYEVHILYHKIHVNTYKHLLFTIYITLLSKIYHLLQCMNYFND